MAETAYLLSERDRDDLAEMLAEWRGQSENSSRRPHVPRQRRTSADVYLAKVPPSGIPALSQSGTTGTGTDNPLDDVPGYAECEVFALDKFNPTAPSFGRVGQLTQWVYNLSPRAIEANETPWVTIHKDKFGEWFVAGTPPSAATEFEEIVRTVDVVTNVNSRECGLTIQKTPFTFTFLLPVGSSVSVSAGGSTGTGTGNDGNDTLIDYPVRLIDIPTSANFVFDAATCTGSINFVTTPFCVMTGGLECCPDYTGTGTG